MICAGCFQSYSGSHSCRPLDTVEANKLRIKLGGQAKAIEHFEALERGATASIPKPFTHPVKVRDVSVTPVIVTEPVETAPVVTVTKPVKVTVSVTDQELLDKLIAERDANRRRAREGMRRLRAKKALERKNGGPEA